MGAEYIGIHKQHQLNQSIYSEGRVHRYTQATPAYQSIYSGGRVHRYTQATPAVSEYLLWGQSTSVYTSNTSCIRVFTVGAEYIGIHKQHQLYQSIYSGGRSVYTSSTSCIRVFTLEAEYIGIHKQHQLYQSVYSRGRVHRYTQATPAVSEYLLWGQNTLLYTSNTRCIRVFTPLP